jgi:hypothetical protein
MTKLIIYAIHDHPKFSGIAGAIIAWMFSLINITDTIEYLNLAGAIIKDIGIICGSSVALASAYIYFKKLFKKK